MSVADKKIVGAPFGNAGELVHVTYDFAADGGAISTLELLEAKGNVIVELVNADVKAAVTSADAIAIDLGKEGGDQWWDGVLKAALAINVQYPGSLTKLLLADGEAITMKITAHAATAGKITFALRVYARV
jgi:hypothetical protein